MQTARQILRESRASVDAVEEFLHNLDESYKRLTPEQKAANALARRKKESSEGRAQIAKEVADLKANAAEKEKAKETGKEKTAETNASPSDRRILNFKAKRPGAQPTKRGVQQQGIPDLLNKITDLHLRDKKNAKGEANAILSAALKNPKTRESAKKFVVDNAEKLKAANDPKLIALASMSSHLQDVDTKIKGAAKTLAQHGVTKATAGSVLAGEHTLADVAKQHPYATAGAVIGAGLLGRHMLKQRAKRQDKEAMYRAMYAQPQVVMQQPMQQSYAQSYGQGYGQYGY